jgi:hypothetical protein
MSQHYFEKCEDETHIFKIGTWESSETPKNSEFNCRGQNTLHWGVFNIIRKLSKLDVDNGLVWAIWTFVAQVMAKKKARNQTSSLIPDH